MNFYEIYSFSESKAEVGSSRISILGSLKRALINEILYFSPPENFPPYSPTFVLYY
jgi:hypothetical protein